MASTAATDTATAAAGTMLSSTVEVPKVALVSPATTTATTTTTTTTTTTGITPTPNSTTTVSQLSTTFSQTTFRNMSMNSIAVVPLLSSNSSSGKSTGKSSATTTVMEETHSTKSYHEFLRALQQHPYCCSNRHDTGNTTTTTTTPDQTSTANDDPLTLLIPNNNLTRPSDWKYETTPFHSFHWNYGCQRLVFHDGRPSSSSMGNDHDHDDQSLHYYHYTASSSYRNYIDLYPHRRTAAVIGILNIQDCIVEEDDDDDDEKEHGTSPSSEGTAMTTAKMIQRACEELQQWSHRYSSPSYGASTFGHSNTTTDGTAMMEHRDVPVTRLFVYDSFNIDTPEIIFDIPRQTNTSSTNNTNNAADTNIVFDTTSSIIAFPPTTIEHEAAMILHTNLVLSDLMVTIFRNLEQKAITATRLIAALDQNNSNSSSTTTSTATTNVPSSSPTTGPSSSSSVSTDATTATGGLARRSLARFVSTATTTTSQQETRPTTKVDSLLGINQLADFVDPDSTLAKTSSRNNNNNTVPPVSAATSSDTFSLPIVPPIPTSTITGTKSRSSNNNSTKLQQPSSSTTISKLFQLLTPLDDELVTLVLESPTIIGSKDMEVLKKREMGRRYKYIGDCCLLAGTPLDAYEHYLKAMELCKGSSTTTTTTSSSTNSNSSSSDPLWYATTLEACAVAHIVMAEIGGYGVDEYLENNFQLPEEIMALARDDTSTRKQIISGNKQTLPEVVFALCDEALNILNRHEKLVNLYTELILKLSMYTAEEAEAHLRCRWGEGMYCYAGEEDGNDQQKRWEKTSVSKLQFNALRTKDGYSMITINTHNRIKKLCSLLTTAVSIGSLDPSTRVDVAVRCARICLVGVKPTHWKGPFPDRVPLPRKAAYFIVVAAEAMTHQHQEIGKSSTAQTLWLLATRLYTCTPNPIDGGGDYGWATICAFCLDCLSTQGSTDVALEAADQLLSLLVQLNPDVTSPRDDSAILTIDSESVSINKDTLESDKSKDLPRAAVSLEDPDVKEAITTANQFAKNIRATYGNFTSASPLLVHHSKWISVKPSPSIEVPLSNLSALSPLLVSLKAVWPHMSYHITSDAQTHCLERATLLRRAIPIRSAQFDFTSLYGFVEKEIPVYISSDVLLQSDPALELECIVKRIPSTATTGGGLETFYNPFAKKMTADGPIAHLVQDEERFVLIKFGNRLALPLHIQRSQLEFRSTSKVETTIVSFVIPPKSADFNVAYPIRVAPDHQSIENADDCQSLELMGVNMTTLGRQIFLPITSNKKSSPVIAESARLHIPCPIDDGTGANLPSNPQIECYPCQPSLNILFSSSKEHVPDVISVSLVDGELLTLPTFHLENSSRHTKTGKIEALEISLVGTPNRKLYDSSVASIPDASMDEFLEVMIHGVGSSHFNVRALTNELNIDSINDDRLNGKNLVVVQIASSCLSRGRLREGCTISVVFRYRGTGTSKTDVWRKRTITLLVSSIKGPRISSIEFRSDLMMDYSLFTAEIIKQRVQNKINIDADLVNVIMESSRSVKKTELATQGVGQYPIVSVCGSKYVVILTVENESRSEIIMSSNYNGTDIESKSGGKPMVNELAIHAGAIANFPMIVSRIARVDENGKPIDVLSTFVRQTILHWKTNATSSSGHQQHCRQGYISIPPCYLHEILYRQYPASISQICTPPIDIELLVDKNVITEASAMKSATVGQPIALDMRVIPASWLPTDILTKSNLHVTMEFRCRRSDDMSMSPKQFVWVGKLQHTEPLFSLNHQLQQSSNDDKTDATKQVRLQHNTKLVLCQPGIYAVSALVRISPSNPKKSVTTLQQHPDKDVLNSADLVLQQLGTENNGDSEVWWSPTSQLIRVV